MLIANELGFAKGDEQRCVGNCAQPSRLFTLLQSLLIHYCFEFGLLFFMNLF